MIDFHTHILPGMDDGSRNAAESVAMLSAEAQQGIADVILTPHYYASENSPLDFLKRRELAWGRLAAHLRPEFPKVHLGAEVQYFEGISSIQDIRHLKIEGTDLLLLEMPFCRWTERMIDDVLDLNDRADMQIVLAHIDRYLPMQRSDVWAYLKSYGVLTQANISFFADWKTKLRAMHMLSKNQIDFLGSDCHNMNRRAPHWDLVSPKALEMIQKSEGYEALLDTLGENS